MANKTLNTRIQLLKNTANYFSTLNPTTLNGELYFVEVPRESDPTVIDIKFKVGDGRNYNDIPFYEDNLLNILGISISDVQDKQILMYDATTATWKNVDLSDDTSIIYLGDSGLSIKGYNEATVGQMLVKDHNNGIAWIDPLSSTELDEKVEIARQHSITAGSYATQSGNSASEASRSAATAELAKNQTIAYVENKFWWGTLAEYNALEKLDEGTFYFIKP